MAEAGRPAVFTIPAHRSFADALADVGEIDSPRGTWSFDEDHNPEQPYFLREVELVDGAPANVVASELD